MVIAAAASPRRNSVSAPLSAVADPASPLRVVKRERVHRPRSVEVRLPDWQEMEMSIRFNGRSARDDSEAGSAMRVAETGVTDLSRTAN